MPDRLTALPKVAHVGLRLVAATLAGRALTASRTCRLAGLLAWMVAAMTPLAAQAPVDSQVNFSVNQNPPSGRLLDANPQPGGRGLNYVRPASPLLGGNLTASGLAGGGLSLRSFSPILDPTTFRGSLGSATLYAFRRDSVGVTSTPLGGGSLGQPYYDPAITVPTGGYLQGLAGFGSAQPKAPKPLDLRLQPDINRLPNLGVQPGALLVPASPVPTISTPSELAITGSIFGPVPPRLPLPPEPPPPWQTWSAQEEKQAERGLAALTSGQRLPSVEEVLATPLGGLTRRDWYPRLGPQSASSEDAWTGRTGGLVLPGRAGPGPSGDQPMTPQITDPRILPGYEVFTDLQIAAALLNDPNPTWFKELEEAVRKQPDLAQQTDADSARDAAEFLKKMLNTPLRTLTGRGASALNDQMLKAEALMEIGRYSEAADRYDSARLLDPVNPLPLIGKGHALLAQGSYRSAAACLLQGIELADRYPGLAEVLLRRLDLEALMGGGEIVDIRRADLMRQLQDRENPELRFLLGYLEYHSGNREQGLENLKRAAGNPRAGPVIGRYPNLLGQTAQPRSGPADQPNESTERRSVPGVERAATERPDGPE